MAVPKRKTTPSKRGMRRSHDRLPVRLGIECPNCGEFKHPHHICNNCGFYGGRHAITLAKDDKTADEHDKPT